MRRTEYANVVMFATGVRVATLSSDVASVAVRVARLDGFSIQATWLDGTSPVGEFTLQACNEVGLHDSESWVDIGSAQSVSGTSGAVLWDVDSPRYVYVRVYYTATSGTASGRLSFFGYTDGRSS